MQILDKYGNVILEITEDSLSGVSLFGANLFKAAFEAADLQGSNLSRAILDRASLGGANLAGSTLVNATLAHAELEDANLAGANLTDSDLLGADLTGANLTSACLVGANLVGVTLRDAGLSRAILPDGRSFEQWQADPLEGICTEPEVRARALAAWDNHTWQDCPLHNAYGWNDLCDAPEDKRLEVATFLALFDGRRLKKPSL